MDRRLYFLLPDRAHALKVVDELKASGIPSDDYSTGSLRQLTKTHTQEFQRSRLRASINFIREMKSYASAIKPGAIVYYNNSLGSPTFLYSDARKWAFSIWNWSEHG